MQPALLLLAAGMGSRYGGLKQLDPMGPSGQTMIDYAVLDGCRGGFGKVVFVIRKDFEREFREKVGRRYERMVDVHYAFQQIDDLPSNFAVPPGRSKPWGTAHAVRAARHVIAEPFAVINADDFYAQEAYAQMAEHLKVQSAENELCASMVGYVLKNTLSPYGTVNRGICKISDGQLKSVEEFTKIGIDEDGQLRGEGLDGERALLRRNAIVSMNFWGFSPTLFEPLEKGFEIFLAERGKDEKSEYYLPSLIDELIQIDAVKCPVLETDSRWFGVTYPEDKKSVVAGLQALTDSGVYDC
ncbi:MAG: sugar phosphate nucleotidyltransferase [Verrucomicrobiota bacterium]